METSQKKCAKCGEVKLPSDFSKDRSKKDGLNYSCKMCSNARMRERRQCPEIKAAIKVKRAAYSQRPEVKTKRRERSRAEYQRQKEDYRPIPTKTIKRQRYAQGQDPNGVLTKQEWRYALSYWQNSCAVCGNSIDKVSAKYWVPLLHPKRTAPLITKRNILPLCPACNFSKHHAHPSEWLERRFGTERSEEIATRIQEYFDQL